VPASVLPTPLRYILCDFASLVRGNVIIYRAQKATQGDDDCLPRRRSWPRSPLALWIFGEDISQNSSHPQGP